MELHGRVDPAAYLGYAVRMSCRDGGAVVPRVCTERVIKTFADVQAKEGATEAWVARGQITRLSGRSRHAERGGKEV